MLLLLNQSKKCFLLDKKGVSIHSIHSTSISDGTFLIEEFCVKVVTFKGRFSFCNGGRCRACGLGDRCFVASNYNWHRHPAASQPTFCVLQPTTSVAKIARIVINKFFRHYFYLNPVSPLSLKN